jgi:hypothetical protein
MGKVVGEPYRGKPDVRFDEGTKGRKVRQYSHCTEVLLYLGVFQSLDMLEISTNLRGLIFYRYKIK